MMGEAQDIVMPTGTLLVGDALSRLAEIPGDSVHCCVTSPPYYGLRDYGVEGQLGLEKTPQEYLARLVAVFREVRRVLHPTGTLWLNMGDSYANDDKWGGTTGGKHAAGLHGEPVGRSRRRTGLKAKDLLMMPARLAIALQDDGWYLRSVIIWYKRNVMPESVTDRPTTAHEYIYLLSKEPRYYYDAFALREPSTSAPQEHFRAAKYCNHEQNGNGAGALTPGVVKSKGTPVDATTEKGRLLAIGQGQYRANTQETGGVGTVDLVMGRNARTVWDICPKPYKDCHFATFPPELPERCIRAGSSQRGCCPACLAPYVRIVEPTEEYAKRLGPGKDWGDRDADADEGRGKFFLPDGERSEQRMTKRTAGGLTASYVDAGWRASCRCDAGESVPCTILDPFMGAGTTAMVAAREGRRWLGCELSPVYAEMAKRRIAGMDALFAATEAIPAKACSDHGPLFSHVSHSLAYREPSEP